MDIGYRLGRMADFRAFAEETSIMGTNSGN